MKKTIFALVVLNILAYFALQAVVAIAPAEEPQPTHRENQQFIRLHVRANSDSQADQDLKLQVRDGILDYTTNLLSSTDDKTEAMALVQENLPELASAAQEVVAQNGFDYPVRASLKEEYFEYREYDGFYLPADVYDSLIVEIGSGEGHNWWCVIFPAVCLSGSSETVSSEESPDSSSQEDFDQESVSASASPSVKVDREAVPEKYRLADAPAPKEVKFEFWIVKFFRGLFGGDSE